jgi:N-acetylmuramoyl-L-alanine amidase
LRLNKNPVRSAGFRVLRAPDVPSVLLELGYLSSAEDVKLMTSEAWRDRATASVAQAIDGFFKMRVAGTPVPKLN